MDLNETTLKTNSYNNLKQSRLNIINIYIATMSAICVIGVLGNLLVIFVVSRFSCMQSVTNIQIVSLAIADLLHLLSIPQLLMTFTGHSFIPFNIACIGYCFISNVNWFAGTLTLTSMSADRFLAVWHPLKSRNYRIKKNAFISVIVIWIIAILLMIPTFMNAQIKVYVNSTKTLCVQEWPRSSATLALLPTISYTFSIGYALPSFLIVSFYSAILYKLREIRLKINRQNRSNSNSRSTYLVLIIVVVFMVCNLPYWANQWRIIVLHQRRLAFSNKIGDLIQKGLYNHSLLDDSTMKMYRQSFQQIMITFFGQMLGFLNSALNPLLYSFMSGQFRASFVAVFTGNCIESAIGNFSNYYHNNQNPSKTTNRLINFTPKSEKLVQADSTPYPDTCPLDPFIQMNPETQDNTKNILYITSDVHNETML